MNYSLHRYTIDGTTRTELIEGLMEENVQEHFDKMVKDFPEEIVVIVFDHKIYWMHIPQ